MRRLSFANPGYLSRSNLLCSRNFKNVKLRPAIVEIWSFYRHSDFTWNQILGNSNSQKMLILTILEVLNFDLSKFEQLLSLKFTKFQSSEFKKLPKMTFLNRLNSPKLDFTQNQSGGKMIKFQQRQSLTSHFESFWSIVQCRVLCTYLPWEGRWCF